MNVKTKPSDRSVTPLGSVVVMFIFFIIPIIVLSVLFKIAFELNSSSNMFVFYAIFPLFIVLSLFLIVGFILFIYLVKRPKKYKAKLMRMREQLYKGKYIIYLGFDVYDEKIKKYGSFSEERKDIGKADFWCYSPQQNNLQVGRDYYIYIKEFNWSIKKIEEYIGDSNVR